MDNKQIKTLLYVIVMEEEVKEIISKYNFVIDEKFTNEYSNVLKAYVSNYKEGITINIVTPIKDPLHEKSCFGTEISFFIAFLGIKHYSPDLVISFGYAGATGIIPMNIGDVCVASKTGIYHRNQMLIDFFKASSSGLYPLCECSNLTKALGFHSSQIGTANDFLLHDEVAFKQNIAVVEMELCSVARACYYNNKTACTGIKIISDGGKTQTKEEREKEFIDSLEILKNVTVETFDKLNCFIVGKSIKDL